MSLDMDDEYANWQTEDQLHYAIENAHRVLVRQGYKDIVRFKDRDGKTIDIDTVKELERYLTGEDSEIVLYWP